MNVPKAFFVFLKTDIVWGLQKLGIISEYEVPLNLKLANNVFLKVDNKIHNQRFVSSTGIFLTYIQLGVLTPVFRMSKFLPDGST